MLLRFLAIVAHLFEALCVSCANEVGLHIVDASLWVHQILVILTFNLDHTHDYSVDHVDRFTLIFLAFGALLLVLHTILLVHPLLLVVLNFDILFKNAILNARAALIELLRILCARLKLNVVERVILALVIVILWVHEVPATEVLLVVLQRLLILSIIVYHVTVFKQVGLLWLRAQRVVCLCALIQEDWITDWPLSAL